MNPSDDNSTSEEGGLTGFAPEFSKSFFSNYFQRDFIRGCHRRSAWRQNRARDAMASLDLHSAGTASPYHVPCCSFANFVSLLPDTHATLLQESIWKFSLRTYAYSRLFGRNLSSFDSLTSKNWSESSSDCRWDVSSRIYRVYVYLGIMENKKKYWKERMSSLILRPSDGGGMSSRSW